MNGMTRKTGFESQTTIQTSIYGIQSNEITEQNLDGLPIELLDFYRIQSSI